MEVSNDNRNLEVGKKLYQCSVCDNVFTWGLNSYWYGSYKDQENNPEKILYFCSEKCKNKH